jgi:hypothetical protein
MGETFAVFNRITDVSYQLIRVFGWPALIFMIWKFRGVVDHWVQSLIDLQGKVQDSSQMIAETKRVVDAISLNHLSHIKDTLVENNTQHEKQLLVLRAIEKGIAVLVDR